MADILDQITQAIKKFPGNAAGAPVDITNLLAGLVSGKGLNGLVDKPVGGSEQINSLFGLSGKSSGLGEDITTAVSSLASPAGATKAALAGMVVPARMMMSFKEFNSVKKMFQEGKSAEEIFKATGAYKVPGDETIKMVLDDSKAKLEGATRKLGYQSTFRPEVDQNVMVGEMFSPKKLPEVLNHPNFWKLVDMNEELSALKETTVRPGMFQGRGGAAYSSESNAIMLGNGKSEDSLLSVLLHEVQHGVQDKASMVGGGNPGMFIGQRDADILQAQTGLRDMFKKMEKGPLRDNVGKYIDTLSEIQPNSYEKYKSLAGEAEARYTQSLFEGKADPKQIPTSQYDVDVKSLIDPYNAELHLVDDDPVIRAILGHFN